MPDALSKTVPIWCAVVNRTVAKLYQLPQNEYDCNLYTPPQVVSAQEHAQIETRIEVWADSLAVRIKIVSRRPVSIANFLTT